MSPLLFLLLLANLADGAGLSRLTEEQLQAPEVEHLVHQIRGVGEFHDASREEHKVEDLLVEEEDEKNGTTTKKPHVHEHHKTSGEFVDEKRNSGEFGVEKATTKKPKKSKGKHRHLPKTFIEVNNRRAIKCARRLSKKGGRRGICGEHCMGDRERS